MPSAAPRDGNLIVLSEDPLNAETRLAAQSGLLTPTSRFYVRNHHAIPDPPARLVVDGLVRTPLSLTLDAIRALPRRTLVVTLECAGNGRAFVDPPAEGEQWRLGAVSTAEWAGATLSLVLERAGPEPGAKEVLFRGADSGTPRSVRRQVAFERSLPVARALHEDTLLAYEMNGEPLSPEHGAPLRLLVPGWYGMAAVKWLERITVLKRGFTGFYQRERYVIGRRPLSTMEPRAVIVWPQDGEAVVRGRHRIRGYAWSGTPPLSVEVSVDAGASWDRAELVGHRLPYAWREWQYAWEAGAAGRSTLLARTSDGAGGTQPLSAPRNELGYANNAVQAVRVTVG
jgi:DMSO/TMAO reductase YedYZ molybdopterin-dependent catalytic subunit